MKRYLIICVMMVGAFAEANAQQIPHYTNFVYNYFQYNPAVAGAVPCLEMKLGYRKQWDGFPDAPVTAYANFHGKLSNSGKFNFHGLGAVVETDDAGPLSYTSLQLAYAYHQKMARRYKLSSGIGIGFQQFRVDYGALLLEDQFDPAIAGSVSEFILPTINAGFWLYRNDRYYGLAVRNVIVHQVKKLGGNNELVRHFHLTAGRVFRVNDDLQFKPAANVNYVGGSDPSLDVAAQMEYREKLTLGLTVRTGNGIGALVKIDVLKYVTLAYAYDLTLSRIRLDGLNTHELTLGIKACASPDRSHVPCAAYD